MEAENFSVTLETTLDPEHGSRRFFLNVDDDVTEYTASYFRRH